MDNDIKLEDVVAVEAMAVVCEDPSRIDNIMFEDVVGDDTVPEVVTLVEVCVIGVVVSKAEDVLERMVDNGWLVEVTIHDVAGVEISIFSSADDVTDLDIDDFWTPDETVGAASDDAVPMLDAVDDEFIVKVAVASTYDWAVEGPVVDEPALEDLIDVAGVKADPFS